MDGSDDRLMRHLRSLDLPADVSRRILGGNACVAVSSAVAWAAARHARLPLWAYLRRLAAQDRVDPGRRQALDIRVVANAALAHQHAIRWNAPG